MSIAEIEIVLSNLNELIAIKSKRISKNKIDSEVILDLSRYFRCIGCGKLLARYDVDEYLHSLYKSAKIYQYMLDNRTNNPDMDKYYLCKSKGLPLLDVLAVSEFQLAQTMAKTMTSTWTKNMEDKDDFIYFDMITDLIQDKLDTKFLKEKLEDFEEALEGCESDRFKIIESIIEINSCGFNEALHNMIEKRKELISQWNDSDHIFNLTEGNIFIEGIALIQIAKKFEIEILDDYQYIPNIVFSTPSKPYQVNFSLW